MSILFKEEGYDKRSPRNNNKMMAALMGSRQSNFSFDILFYPQYQDDNGQVVCYPGSVFEGIVQVKVSAPTPVHHIKLVFKASGKLISQYK